MLNVAAKAAAATVTIGALSSLGGCSSAAQTRNEKKNGEIGSPIADDPIAIAKTPSPLKPTSPSFTRPITLSTIPGFVIPRSKWTSEQPKRWLADPMKRISRITIHHDAIMPVPSGSYTDSLRRMRLIRKGHLRNGWADIGYHFAIDPKGRIWQARPLELQGAHVKHHNPGNLGIVVFGNYERIRPTQASLDSVNKMVTYAMERFSVPISKVYTHQELRSTACPGRYLQEQMRISRARGGSLNQPLSDRIART